MKFNRNEKKNLHMDPKRCFIILFFFLLILFSQSLAEFIILCSINTIDLIFSEYFLHRSVLLHCEQFEAWDHSSVFPQSATHSTHQMCAEYTNENLAAALWKGLSNLTQGQQCDVVDRIL